MFAHFSTVCFLKNINTDKIVLQLNIDYCAVNDVERNEAIVIRKEKEGLLTIQWHRKTNPFCFGYPLRDMPRGFQSR